MIEGERRLIIAIPDKYLFRPDEAAKLLDVHPLTLYRWVREEKLQVIKTPGGHNRIPRGEILRIMTVRETTE
ncbi:MAG: excisionase family DNA-binding protein [Nitrospira sp.]|nr:excisionase family DNA-binding protein [Nitrospira sp.]